MYSFYSHLFLVCTKLLCLNVVSFMMTVTCMFTGSSSYVVQIKRCVRDRVFAVIPAATGRGTYLTRDTNINKLSLQ